MTDQLDTDDFWTTTTLLTHLPGVAPRKAKVWLRDLLLEAYQQERQQVDVDGIMVATDELAELLMESTYGTDCASPRGARLAIRPYEAGALPRRSKKGSAVPDSVVDYGKSEDALAAKARERDERRHREKAQRQQLLEHPETLPEEKFTHELLDAIFWNKLGKGVGELIVGGIAVRKTLAGYSSNSGRSRDYAVTFTWISPNGNPKQLTRPSIYADNRRNDSERDWGLPD